MRPSCVININAIQQAYKVIQQTAKALRLDENDDELKAFYAKIIVYCTILESHLVSASENAASLSDETLGIFLVPLRRMSTVFVDQISNDKIKSWLQDVSGIFEKVRRTRNNSTKIDILSSRLNFGTTEKERCDIEKSLDHCEEELRIRYPEDPSQWAAEDTSPQLSIGEPTFAVQSAAQSIFQAMMECMNCPCAPAHDLGARLCLGTYRKSKKDPDDEQEEVDFNMFLESQRNWQEVIVHTVKERQVKLIVDEGTKAKSAPTARTMRVKNICEQITKTSSRTSYRLVFKVIRNRLFKLQSERCCGPDYKAQNAISLDEFLRSRSGSFTEKTKRILAVFLSSAVFHLHGTQWLQSSWNSTDVWFFRTSSSSIPLRPFIHRPLSSNDCCASNPETNQGQSFDTGDLDPDDIDPDDVLCHNCPALIILARMLLEVYFVAPFDVLAHKFGVNLGPESESTCFSRYVDVDCVFQACKREIPENSQFYLAVENCLDPKVWQNDEGDSLDLLTLRSKIYSQVVLPLETELSQAYGDIDIEDLDRFAQNVDFGNWGQLTQNWNQPHNSQPSHLHSPASLPLLYNQENGSQPHLPITEADDRGARPWFISSPNKRRFSRSPSGLNADSALSDLASSSDSRAYPHSTYTVGILCALPLELLAVRALFDTKHDNPKYVRGDSNTYALGNISGHMVVAACLPAGEYGTNAAADSASNMKRTFFNVEFCLLVGIGGGAPTEENDIRLGDVVVSLPTTKYPGVIQYDRGKEIEGATFELTGSLHPPPRCLMTAVSSLRSNPDLHPHALQPSIDEIAMRVPESLKARYQHPGQETDCLLKSACTACQMHGACGNVSSHIHSRRRRPTNHPEIHYGLIASGNRVLKDASVRNRWAREHGILCFEMEAAGVVNTFPCLVIRGICDYADANKNKTWQHYAAATAAAYAKLLLSHTVANDTSWLRASEECVEDIVLPSRDGSKRQRT
ncbi:hypothetical protein FLONG3_1103 [Fusarium longipes]|uniref:Uncharacterized protein n=1 Tax=Fusarium longipes TaxID=694270 RepID=A0A395T7Q1_9HYPO|nr:hypothetical protein FLONG3_1103 [Fusarium longipes]